MSYGEANDKLIFQNLGQILDVQKEIKQSLARIYEKLDEQQALKTDVDWLKRSYWMIMSVAMGGLGTAIFSLMK